MICQRSNEHGPVLNSRIRGFNMKGRRRLLDQSLKEEVMTQTTTIGAKIAAAIGGGFVGFCLGSVLGTVASGLIGNALGSSPSEVIHLLGMAAGLVGGAWLGASLAGRPRGGVIFIVIGLAIAA